MLSRYVMFTILLVLVAVIVAGCSPSDTPPAPNASAVDATAETPAGADLSCAIAHTPVYAFFRNLAHLAGIGPIS